MKYSYYKKARNASWQVLIDFKIISLPVKVTTIAKKAGIKVFKNSVVSLLNET